MSKASTSNAAQFVAGCICQAEADGYQQFEESGNTYPDGTVPDDWGRNGTKFWFTFQGEEFTMIVRRKRRRK